METILVVEDEDVLRRTIKSVLESKGYSVLQASGAREATYMRETHPGPIDLLLTDIVLSGRSGREIAKEFLDYLPDIRVIYMSGYTGDSAFQAELEKSNTLFLSKPFSMITLLKQIRQLLTGLTGSSRLGTLRV
jgi:two-component system, cell cycle sensor histidine kinase and response regulator CckA